MSLLETRHFYKPFQYPWAFEYMKSQHQAHWLPTEIPMADDIMDFNSKLNDKEKNLIIQVLRFFTQGDIEVQNNYMTRLSSVFVLPEVASMLASFASIETIHVWAYSYLNDSLKFPESEYSAFMEIEAMRNKYEFLQQFKVSTQAEIAKTLAVFGGFMEGVQLFGSFAILMNFPRRNLLKNVGQIISWSIRDESLHSKAICHLFRQFIQEHPHLWRGEKGREFKKELYDICRTMVDLEDKFIDKCFEMGAVEGLQADQVKQYIRYIADVRLCDLGLKPNYNIETNPLPWLDIMVNAKEHANFFEAKPTEYSKGAIIDDWAP